VSDIGKTFGQLSYTDKEGTRAEIELYPLATLEWFARAREREALLPVSLRSWWTTNFVPSPPLRLREIAEVDKRRHSRLDLHELSGVVVSFLFPYLFVRAAHLCPTTEQNKRYALLFEVPSVPEGMTELHRRFIENIQCPPGQCLDLLSVYGEQDRDSLNEWVWYEVKDVKKVKDENSEYLLLPGDAPLCLCTRGTVEDERRSKEPKPGSNYLIRSGEGWEVAFGAERTVLKNTESIRTIAYLLMHEGKEIEVETLTRIVNGLAPEDATGRVAKMTDDELEREGMSKSTMNGGRGQQDGADRKKARELAADPQMAKKGEELAADVERARQGRIQAEIDEAKAEWAKFMEMMSILKATDKKMAVETEKARVNVRNNIDRAIKRLHKAGLTNLAKHLGDRIDKGVKCCIYKYDPNDPGDWYVTL
jgi:hypothetical protein